MNSTKLHYSALKEGLTTFFWRELLYKNTVKSLIRLIVWFQTGIIVREEQDFYPNFKLI